MAPSTSKRPDGLSGFAAQVFDVLAEHTMFPWPVMKTQCERAGVDPFMLSAAHLKKPLLDSLTASIARFTSTAKGERARMSLEALRDGYSRTGPDSRPPR